MSSESIQPRPEITSPFDRIKRVDQRGEYWVAREMQPHLDYAKWQNFEAAIRRAISSCKNNGRNPQDHFTEFSKPIVSGKGGTQYVTDYRLTRYGAYLVAMNGDPDKPAIAAAQHYFALMTRAAELDPRLGNSHLPVTLPDRAWSVRIRETIVPHIQYLNIHHPDCFTVASTLFTQILVLEDELIGHLFEVNPSDRPDISIGKLWAVFRRLKGLPEVDRFAPLWLPNQKIKVPLRVYDNIERGPCETWFGRLYLPEKLGLYLSHKPEFKSAGPLPTASVADATCRKLTGQPAHLKPPIRKQLEAAGGRCAVGYRPPQLTGSQPMLFD